MCKKCISMSKKPNQLNEIKHPKIKWNEKIINYKIKIKLIYKTKRSQVESINSHKFFRKSQINESH